MDSRLDNDDFFELDQLIRAYLGQDMELDARTVPEAVARYSRLNDAGTKDRLRSAMEGFAQRFDNRLQDEFARRYAHDFMPEGLGMDVNQFFDMVRAILADPSAARAYLADSAAGRA